MSNVKKVIFSISALFIIILVGSHIFLSQHYNPMKKINAMNEAFNKQDKEAFYQFFHIPDGTISNANVLYEIVQDMNWRELRSSLIFQIENIQEKIPTDTITYYNDFLYLDQKPIFFGLYKDVTFNIIPTKVAVHIPFANTNLTIGDITIQSKKDDETIEVGNFFQVHTNGLIS